MTVQKKNSRSPVVTEKCRPVRTDIARNMHPGHIEYPRRITEMTVIFNQKCRRTRIGKTRDLQTARYPVDRLCRNEIIQPVVGRDVHRRMLIRTTEQIDRFGVAIIPDLSGSTRAQTGFFAQKDAFFQENLQNYRKNRVGGPLSLAQSRRFLTVCAPNFPLKIKSFERSPRKIALDAAPSNRYNRQNRVYRPSTTRPLTPTLRRRLRARRRRPTLPKQRCPTD